MQGNYFFVREALPSKADFPLPTLGAKLEAIRENVRIGRGCQLIRCVPLLLLLLSVRSGADLVPRSLLHCCACSLHHTVSTHDSAAHAGRQAGGRTCASVAASSLLGVRSRCSLPPAVLVVLLSVC